MYNLTKVSKGNIKFYFEICFKGTENIAKAVKDGKFLGG